jgi:hypothetical protein
MLNFNTERDSILKNIHVSMKIPDDLEVDHMEVFSPDKHKTYNVEFCVAENGVAFMVQELRIYNMVAIQLK